MNRHILDRRLKMVLLLYLPMSISLVSCKQADDLNVTTPAKSAAGTIPTPTSTATSTGPSSPTPISEPQAIFQAPPCQANTSCLGQFKLEQAFNGTFSFDWQTNDSLYGTTPPPGAAPYGEPNVQYVETSGTVTFTAGETEQDIHVQNINSQGTPITIGVIMSNCAVNGVPGDCALYFPSN